LAHLCFVVIEQGIAKAVFTGDTLFNAGVGHCRGGGDVDVLYQTIVEQFHSLDDSVVIYPGHKYLENNLLFTLSIEPDNQDAQGWLVRASHDNDPANPVTTSIGDERKFNTFFRLNSSGIRSMLGCESDSDRAVFRALRARRDNW
jgi:hydroxyacylglutathione hydrolase